MKRNMMFLLVIFSLLLCSRNVLADFINFKNFTKNPTVTISDDGYTATIKEDLTLSPVGLWWESFLIPTNYILLSFSYTLSVPEGNVDYFDFNLKGTLYEIAGGSVGTFTGSKSFILSSEDWGKSIYIGFFLASDWPVVDIGYDSTLSISNLFIAVSEPSTIILLSSGVLAIMSIRKKIKTRRL